MKAYTLFIGFAIVASISNTLPSAFFNEMHLSPFVMEREWMRGRVKMSIRREK